MSVLPEPVGAWIRTCAPDAIAGQPSGCGGVGASNVRSNQARVAGEKAASGSMQPGYRPWLGRTSVPSTSEALSERGRIVRGR